MARQSKTRFIAGAVCPECRAMDRIRLTETAGRRLRQCVACGAFEEETRESAQILPLTRFSKQPGSVSAATDSVQRLRILDESSPKDDADRS